MKKEKKFKPMLAPNKRINIQALPYPLLASYKIDGVRGLITDNKILSRSLKLIPNKQIQEKFQSLTAIETDTYVDGEFYNPNIPFQAIVSCAMTQDYNNPTAIKKWNELCKKYDITISREEAFQGIKLYIFDRVKLSNPDEHFNCRFHWVENTYTKNYPKLTEIVKQKIVNTPEEAKQYYEEALEWGCDGLILRSSEGRYKYGRATLNEALIFKLKPYVTFDAKIIGVIQATKVNPNAEKKINELGRSITSKKKGDRILINKACDFVVMHEGKNELKVSIAMNEKEKREVWENRQSYIGRYIEYKGLEVGAKDLPRHPVFLRFRDDK